MHGQEEKHPLKQFTAKREKVSISTDYFALRLQLRSAANGAEEEVWSRVTICKF
jgi:hypothetical protein